MLEGLFDLIRGRRIVPQAPPDFRPQLPETDEPEDDLQDDFEPDLESIAGVGCIVTYAGSKGAVSIRRITCRKLSRKETTHYLQAYCHEREALRTFRIDRMVEVACGVTGEVFTPGSKFFTPYSVASDGGAAVGFGLNVRLATDLRAGLNVLAFLARVDGQVVPEEQEVMARYCQSFGLRFCSDSFDYEGTCRYACHLAPDAETFYVSLERLLRNGAPQGLAQLTKRAAGDLIDADGIQAPEEFHYALKLQEFL
jgi:hypothetical protein